MTEAPLAREIVERVFQAPRALVWELWTSKAGWESWYGPVGFSAEVASIDVRVGGVLDATMRATDPKAIAMMESRGRPTSWPSVATFTEVVPPERLAFKMAVPTGPGGPELFMFHTVELTETEEGVRVVLTIEAARAEMIAGAAMGWRSSFGRIAALVEPGADGA